MANERPCIDCGAPTLGSLDAAGAFPICWRPCMHLRWARAMTGGYTPTTDAGVAALQEFIYGPGATAHPAQIARTYA